MQPPLHMSNHKSYLITSLRWHAVGAKERWFEERLVGVLILYSKQTAKNKHKIIQPNRRQTVACEISLMLDTRPQLDDTAKRVLGWQPTSLTLACPCPPKLVWEIRLFLWLNCNSALYSVPAGGQFQHRWHQGDFRGRLYTFIFYGVHSMTWSDNDNNNRVTEVSMCHFNPQIWGNPDSKIPEWSSNVKSGMSGHELPDQAGTSSVPCVSIFQYDLKYRRI